MGLMTDFPQSFTHDQLFRRMIAESVDTSDAGAASFFKVFKDLIPKSADLIKSFINPLSKFAEPQKEALTLDNKTRTELLKKIQTVNFLAYEDTLISVPEGMKGKLIPYLTLLTKQSDLIGDVGLKVLSDYNLELSMFLSNADIRLSLKSHSSQYARVRSQRMEYQKAISEYYSKTDPTIARRKVSDVIDRFSDLGTVFKLEEELRSIRDRKDCSAAIAELKKSSELLLLVRDRLDSGDIANLSGQVAKNLAEGAYEVASYAEYMSLYAFYVETAVASINNTADQLSTLFLNK